MNDFDALLKRSFAEAAEPVDDGFTVQVARGVARRETAGKIRLATQGVGLAAAGAAVFYGGSALVGMFGQEFLASAGLGLADAYSALTTGASSGQGMLQSMGAGLTQILLVTAALAGGAVAYRATQD